MNPLSPFTHYRRHKRHTALLLGLISLVTAGLFLMVALSWAIFIEPLSKLDPVSIIERR
jgi:hypothetical protein